MPVVGRPVEMRFGNQSTYDISTLNESTLYFIEDTRRIYLGSKLYGAQVELSSTDIDNIVDLVI